MVCSADNQSAGKQRHPASTSQPIFSTSCCHCFTGSVSVRSHLLSGFWILNPHCCADNTPFHSCPTLYVIKTCLPPGSDTCNTPGNRTKSFRCIVRHSHLTMFADHMQVHHICNPSDGLSHGRHTKTHNPSGRFRLGSLSACRTLCIAQMHWNSAAVHRNQQLPDS